MGRLKESDRCSDKKYAVNFVGKRKVQRKKDPQAVRELGAIGHNTMNENRFCCRALPVALSPLHFPVRYASQFMDLAISSSTSDVGERQDHQCQSDQHEDVVAQSASPK
jgi:hypothetical protein